jgi:DNA adenine methylase
MTKYKSPLRYPGGKFGLAPFIADIIVRNGLSDGIYAEAYCGGAAIALDLVTGEFVRTAYINDADFRIYAFWDSVLHSTEHFLRLLWDARLDMAEWHRQKEILDNYSDYDLLEVGFATFFLNRCNWSGILSGGPIGGYNQKSNWSLDARFAKKELAKRIELIALYSDRIKVTNLDALVFLNNIEGAYSPSDRLLVYLDPPYYSMGDRLYLNYYTPEDHAELARYLLHVTHLNWVLSYDDVHEIRDLYQGHRKSKTEVFYHANLRKLGRELIMHSPTLQSREPPNKLLADK